MDSQYHFIKQVTKDFILNVKDVILNGTKIEKLI